MRATPLRPEDVLHDVGRRVAEVRAERGWTQEHLAARAEISWKYLQQIEAGRENLTLRSLVKFANLLGTSMATFFIVPTSRDIKPGRPKKRREASVPTRKSRRRR